MKIHKEGSATIILVLGVVVLSNFFLNQINASSYIVLPFAIVSSLFWVFIVSFFRIPKRVHVIDPNAIVAPADGKIVVIEEVVESEILKTKCRQISVFMSPLNVHVNRYPCNGTVLESIYHPGLKLPAFNPKSSELNERTTICLQTEMGSSIVFRQIAGAVARRIVVYAKQNDVATQNQEFGFIKFGSRVDLFIPLDFEVCVALDQKVRGGQTILARSK